MKTQHADEEPQLVANQKIRNRMNTQEYTLNDPRSIPETDVIRQMPNKWPGFQFGVQSETNVERTGHRNRIAFTSCEQCSQT